jgi:tetratricopeptide (TPR) repeat protein
MRTVIFLCLLTAGYGSTTRPNPAFSGGIPFDQSTSARIAQAMQIVFQTQQMTLHGQWNKAASKLKVAISAAVRGDDHQTEAVLRTELARVLVDRSVYYRQDLGTATKTLEEAMRAAQFVQDQESIAALVQEEGRASYFQRVTTNELEEPRHFFLRALAIRNQIQDRAGLAQSYFYLGLTYQHERQATRALEYFQKSLLLAEEIGDKELQGHLHRHLGFLQEDQGRLKEAYKSYSRSLLLFQQAGATVAVPFALNVLAEFAVERHDERSRAQAMLEESIRFGRAANSTRAIAEAQMALAKIHMEQKNIPEALSFSDCAFDTAKEYGDPFVIQQAESVMAAIRHQR